MSQSFLVDVQILYWQTSVRAANGLKERLAMDGLRVNFSPWEIVPGSLQPTILPRWVSAAPTTLFLVSSEALAPRSEAFEHLFRYFLTEGGPDLQLILIRLDDVEIPGPLDQAPQIDWRSASEAGYREILKACRSPIPLGADQRQRLLGSWRAFELKGESPAPAKPEPTGYSLTRLSPSVSMLRQELTGKGPLSAAAVAEALLEIHPEYGRRREAV